MTIIRELDKNGNVIDPSTHEEYMETWNHCISNMTRPDGTVVYSLVELGMFGSYDNTSDSSSDNDTFYSF